MSHILSWTERKRLMGSAIRFEFCPDEKARGLLVPLFDALDLSYLDYITLRDLFRLTGQRAETPLVAVLLVLSARLADGSLCLHLDPEALAGQMSGGAQHRTAQALADAFLEQLQKGAYRKLVADAAEPDLPVVSAVQNGRRLLYFQRYFLHEQRVNRRISDFGRRTPSAHQDLSRHRAITRSLYTPALALRSGPAKSPIAKDDLQIKAIETALSEPFVIVSGGPGTGKTSLTVNIIRALLRSGTEISQVVLCAPTGRAAQRITESVHRSIESIENPGDEDRAMLALAAFTLHRTLRYSPRKRDFFYSAQRPLPASVVIMDEASMVDVALMDAFLQSLRTEHTKLILLGDKNQLPSVEAGAVFADLIPAARNKDGHAQRLIVLETTYRAGKRLHGLAEDINRGVMPALTPTTLERALNGPDDSWHWIDVHDSEAWYQILQQWARHFYLSPYREQQDDFRQLLARARKMSLETLTTTENGRRLLEGLFAVVESARILCLTLNGLNGCRIVNRLMADFLADQIEMRLPAGTAYGSGTLVLVTRNAPALDLYNGDLGILLCDREDNLWACFRRGGTHVAYPPSQLPAWELGFATTVHKSQGSEFDNVLLVMPENEMHRLLSREILYTGVTRARKRLILYGGSGALENALAKCINRESGLLHPGPPTSSAGSTGR